MKIEEFRLALTYFVQQWRCAGQDVAILWSKNTPIFIQASPTVSPVQTSIDLPIVSLLRSYSQGQFLPRGSIITTTAAPTEACLGMARMCGVDSIYHMVGGFKKVTCGRTGTSVSTPGMGYDGPIYNVVYRDRRGSTNQPWDEDPAYYRVNLKNWENDIANSRLPEAAAVKAARTLGVGGIPTVASTFGSSGLEYLGLTNLVGDSTVVDNIFMMLAFEIVSQVSGFSMNNRRETLGVGGTRSKIYSGQNIGSVMSDREGNIVGWGFNTNKENKTRHGETNLIAAFLAENPGDSLPDGGAIYTTLEPCEMCSGMIARTVKTGDTFRVIYGQKDLNVTSTALQRKANGGITMLPSQAGMLHVHSGLPNGGGNKLVAAMEREQSGMVQSKLQEVNREAQRMKGRRTFLTKEQHKTIDTQTKEAESFKATTKYLKTKETYEKFFGVARPQWWYYLWDHMTAKLADIKRWDNKLPSSTLLNDPAMIKLTNELDVIYMLVEQFMQKVKRQANTV